MVSSTEQTPTSSETWGFVQLLKSTRGTRGGYRLARSPHQITLAQLLEAIEGPMRLARCCSVPEGEEEAECQLEESCLIRGNMRRVHRAFDGFQQLGQCPWPRRTAEVAPACSS